MRFKIGEVECASVSAGEAWFNATSFFANALPDELTSALKEHGIQGEKILTPFNCLLIRLPDQNILIDVGMDRAGKLLENLQSEGLTPDQIHMVILSHAHLDHIGGAVDESGRPAFPNARYVLSRVDWETHSEPVRPILNAIQPQLTLIDLHTPLFPELETRSAPGHSPGQIVVRLTSSGETLVYTADTFAHPIYLQHPDWHIRIDSDPKQAIQTRREILNWIADENFWAYSYHITGLYKLARTKNGWKTISDPSSFALPPSIT